MPIHIIIVPCIPVAVDGLVSADLLVYVGSLISILWGAAHIAPVKSVVAGFGPISEDNRRIITMEWVAEGLTLIFIGALAALVAFSAGVENPVSVIVLRSSAVILIVLAMWTFLTGARTPILAMKLCPIVKSTVALLFLLAGFVEI
ncbi:hypothetical protein RJ40_07205 [Methanofollis aquaemaris]|uniref:Uncharacterized protein n=1 Tax=Methanofollis aquaemaris TaxID=126734 RepID=A0A8A3S5G4_9EURY|nr:hypothetical protein [Methanofollis aquaemaris]QSZ67302.1 hypothetical protein RJ40_07205 [Methanofollis aquaemaris]